MDQIINVPELFGCDVFNESTMQQRLSPATYNVWKQCIENGRALDPSVADEIAEAMKVWAFPTSVCAETLLAERFMTSDAIVVL